MTSKTKNKTLSLMMVLAMTFSVITVSSKVVKASPSFIPQVFYDDFNYTSSTDPTLAQHNWLVQDGTGMRPGDRTVNWKASNVTFGAGPADPTFPSNNVMTISATATGKTTTSSESQIREAYEKFGDGIYSSRVYFNNTASSGDTTAKDKVVETFFPINRNEYIGWTGYSEADYEYLPNDGWGATSTNLPSMYWTSWGPYTLSSAGTQVNVAKLSNNTGAAGKSYLGWHTLTLVVKNGINYYYIDGTLCATHGAPAGGAKSPMAPAYNLWLLPGGIASSTTSRTWNEHVNWMYYTNDLSAYTDGASNITSTVDANVANSVKAYKTAGTHFTDTVPNPVTAASNITVNGTALSGFASATTEYTCPLTAGTTTVPTVTATATDSHAIVTVIPATSVPGTTTVMVQSTDLVSNTTYHINFTVASSGIIAPPIASVGSGPFVQGFNVSLSTPINSGATIYYTTDGTTPTTTSAQYSTPFSIAGTYAPTLSTIKAIAVSGDYQSQVATFKYSTLPLTPQVVASPTITKTSGTGYVTVTITDTATSAAIQGSDIYYTTDGSDPTSSATRILYTGPFTLTSTATVKAVATFPGATTSNPVASATCTVTGTCQQVTAPTSSVSTGTITTADHISLSSATSGATIYYTIDGSTPSPLSPVYSQPFVLPTGGTVVVKALAVASGMANSNISTSTYTVNPAQQDATLSSITVGGTALSGFASGTTDYNVILPAGTTTVPVVAATTTDSNANAVVTPAATLPGTTTIKVTAEDGNTTKTYNVNFTVDNTAPVTSAKVTGSGSNDWYNSNVTVTLISTDDLSGVDKSEYRIGESGDWIPYNGPVVMNQDGAYTLEYRSIDRAGNTEETKQQIIKIDKTMPQFKLTVNGNDLENGASFDDYLPLTFKASDDLSGIASAKINIGGQDYIIDTKTQQGIDIDMAGEPGSYTAVVTLEDVAGNKLETSINFNVTTSINSMMQLVSRYIDSGELSGPIIPQLTNDLNQAQHQLDIGRPDNAAKHIQDFADRLNNKALSNCSSEKAKAVLNADAQYIK